MSGNLAVGVGDYFNIGCDERCLCISNNVSHCVPRCPLYDKNLFPNCQFIPDSNDSCCMIPNCPNTTGMHVCSTLKLCLCYNFVSCIILRLSLFIDLTPGIYVKNLKALP